VLVGGGGITLLLLELTLDSRWLVLLHNALAADAEDEASSGGVLGFPFMRWWCRAAPLSPTEDNVVTVVVVAADGDDTAVVVFTNDSDVGDDVHVNDGVADEGGVLCGDAEPSGLLLSADGGGWWLELGVAGDGC
jgi:hypothetical protein